MANQQPSEWIKLGTTSIRASWLKSVKEKEALEFFADKAIHPDRVRNAWKRANGKK